MAEWMDLLDPDEGALKRALPSQIHARALEQLLDALNEEIDELEEGIESWPSSQVRVRISDLRHDLLHVRRTLGPTRDAVRAIVDRRIDVGEGPELLPREIELNFTDAYDKLL